MALIRTMCELEEVHYVESALNPSDLSTRATATVEELGPNSLHQNGPECSETFQNGPECFRMVKDAS